jgi:hypothetical protein
MQDLLPVVLVSHQLTFIFYIARQVDKNIPAFLANIFRAIKTLLVSEREVCIGLSAAVSFSNFSALIKAFHTILHTQQSPNTNLGSRKYFSLIMQNFITAPNVLVSKKVEAR